MRGQETAQLLPVGSAFNRVDAVKNILGKSWNLEKSILMTKMRNILKSN